MKKRARLTSKQKGNIIEAYDVMLTPVAELAADYGVTRQSIYKILWGAGIDTTKQLIPVSCSTCGKVLYRHKARIRRQLNHFCNKDCHEVYLKANGTKARNPNVTRMSKSVVSQHFQLQAGHIVHHANGNQYDNRLVNLRVFACQGDHIRVHNGFDVEPIWDGRYI